jgi:hypothetical protein
MARGAMAVLQAARRFDTPNNGWLKRLLTRKPRMVAAITLANKMAHGLWAMSKRRFRPIVSTYEGESVGLTSSQILPASEILLGRKRRLRLYYYVAVKSWCSCREF